MADAAARRVRPSEEGEFTNLLALLEARTQLMGRLFGILCGDEEAAGQQRDEAVQGLQECCAQEVRLHELLQERLELADLMDENYPAPWQQDNAQTRARLQLQLDHVAATDQEVESLHVSLQGAVGQAREVLMSQVRAAANTMQGTSMEVRYVQHTLIDQQRQREQAAQRWSSEQDAAGSAAAVEGAAAAGGGEGLEAAVGQRLLPVGDASGILAGAEPLACEQRDEAEDHFSSLSKAFESFSAGVLASIAEVPACGGQPEGSLGQQGKLQASPVDSPVVGADQSALAAVQLEQQLLERQASPVDFPVVGADQSALAAFQLKQQLLEQQASPVDSPVVGADQSALAAFQLKQQLLERQASPVDSPVVGADQSALAAFQLEQQLLEQQAQQDGTATDWSNRHERLLSDLRARLSRAEACALGVAASEEEVVPEYPAQAEAAGRGGSATSTSSRGLEVPIQAPIVPKEVTGASAQQPEVVAFTPTTGSVASDVPDRSLCSEPGAEAPWPQQQAEARELLVGSVASDQGISTPRGAGAPRAPAPTESASCNDKLPLGASQSFPPKGEEHLSLVEKLWAQLEVTAGHAQASNDEARRLQQLVLEQQQQQQAAQQQWAAQQQQLLAELQELREAVNSKSAVAPPESQECTGGSAALAAAAAAAAANEPSTPAGTLCLPPGTGGASRLQSRDGPPGSPPCMSRASRLQSREEPSGTAVIRASAEAERSGLSTIAFIQVKEEEESVAWSEALAAQQALQAKDRELEEALAGALAAQASAKEEVAGIAASAQELESFGGPPMETANQVSKLQAQLQEAMDKVRANSDEVWRLQLQLLDRQRQQEILKQATAKMDGELPQADARADAQDPGQGLIGTANFPPMQRSPRPPAGKEETSPRTVEVAKGAPALPMVGSPFDLPRKSVRRRLVDGVKGSDQQGEGDDESVSTTIDLGTSLDGSSSARAPSPQLRRTRSTSTIAAPSQQRAASLEKKPQPKQQQQQQQQQQQKQQQKQAPAAAAAQQAPRHPQPQVVQSQVKQGTFLHQPQVPHQQPQMLHQPQAHAPVQPQQLQAQSPRAISPVGGRIPRLSMPAWPTQPPLGSPAASAGGTPLGTAPLASPAALLAQIPGPPLAMGPSGLSATASPLGASLTLNLQPRLA